ncbi:uncharacterized protein K489DRAFT_382184 [Dissoconium aciculare CBS 342.82]|jgi:hypothetical protein|uniref:Uncharacterized protein n=1 Tax=Dissoconium aciculare CBS 342.82 TaxID=1314786 RepID=A0A6J3M0W3_9PEZI|nr:uncharacterized protein K489DRAFT_382184 [Dissoconium aciculare CBS 342.82]KAF1821144.1 hypothetical protein K489DRAFT_382184 [Dissoconium aciculare CBS 342.82]
MFSQSRSWIAPQVEEARNKQRLNDRRKRLCPQSPFWTADFDLRKHMKEWRASLERIKRRQEVSRAREIRAQSNLDIPTVPAIKPALQGKLFDTNHSAVLALPTVFTHSLGRRRLAPWPSREEMKYEGDDRVSTDRLHGRFLPAPRVDDDETVPWMHRAIIAQEALENFHYPYPCEVEIFLRMHWVPDLEITDLEGRNMLGRELMDLLDPKEVY